MFSVGDCMRIKKPVDVTVTVCVNGCVAAKLSVEMDAANRINAKQQNKRRSFLRMMIYSERSPCVSPKVVSRNNDLSNKFLQSIPMGVSQPN
jgi:hypothetical protein